MMICQDFSGDNCPCSRAEEADCPHCSLLSGKAFCSCDWQGCCIYELYQWWDKKTAAVNA